MKDLRLLSLFSGCGGMDIGFEGGFNVYGIKILPNMTEQKISDKITKVKETRFKTVFANDILESAKIAWTNYFKDRIPEDVYHLESIVDLVKRHENGEKVFPDNIDIVTGGFPCQDFSVAGKRRGFKSLKNHLGQYISQEECSLETRGMLYYWMKRVIDITRPKMFVAENVKGLSNMKDIVKQIREDFSSNGYYLFRPRLLRASDFGIPQNRERIIFIGIREDAVKKCILEKLKKISIDFDFDIYPTPSHLIDNDVTVGNLLKDFPEPGNTSDRSHENYSSCKFMGFHCQGQKEINLEGLAPTIRSEHHGNIEFRRLSFEHGGKHFVELNSGLLERRLTPRECALIQSFPPDYEFVLPRNSKNNGVSTSKAYKLIGNAVPPLMAFNLAWKIQRLWDLYFE